MAYSDENKTEIINEICREMQGGASLRSALISNKISSATFYTWIDSDEEKLKQYARACEDRAEAIADEILDIADSSEADVYKDDDGNTKIDGNVVQRAKLQVDTRKWLLGKLHPKKYGDKVQLGGDPENPIQLVWNENKNY